MPTPFLYIPDYETECRICGTVPTVTVVGHEVPETELCASHFWGENSTPGDWNQTDHEDNE